MSDNIQRSQGRSKAYKQEAGGVPVDLGAYIGKVKNTSDLARSGKIQVYIEYLSGPDENDSKFWKDVSYISPFYGYTSPASPPTGFGGFVQNKHSYGMWFTPPDVDTEVICFFVNGDPNQGYYLGSKVNTDAHHMVPAIGSTTRSLKGNSSNPYFNDGDKLPTVEINDANAAADGPRFFDLPKPVHSYVSFVLLQQGLLDDPIRGVIGSNSYRESPSTVYGISTPGRPIYNGGLTDEDIRRRLELSANDPTTVTDSDVKIIGRRGGHSFVMDDGDLQGNDQLVRIRTAKGHQIIMSDSGDSLHIIHANGYSWWELGAEGTIDMYAANSVNIRSQGDINMHADRSINLNSQNGTLNLAADRAVVIESEAVQITGTKAVLAYSEKFLGLKSDGSLSLQAAKGGTWNGGDNMVLSAGCISLNGGSAPDVPKTTKLARNSLPDTTFQENVGWVSEQGAFESIVNRAPTHEPYPLHNRGITNSTNLASPGDAVNLSVAIEEKFVEIEDVEFDAIEAADYESQSSVNITIGTIASDQVTGMLAQSSKLVDQEFNEISSLGVGKYGFSAEQLENAGYLKPGTVEFYIIDADSSEQTILESPGVWSGFAGVNSVADLLNDENLQDSVQADLYLEGLNNLTNQGIVTGQEDPAKLAGLVTAAGKYSANTVNNWIQSNGVLSPEISVEINKLVRSGQYAVELADQKIDEQIKGVISSQSATGTVSRPGVDQAGEVIIDNQKVQQPSYGTSTNRPTRERRLTADGNVVNTDIVRTDPFVDVVIGGILTRVYGSFELLVQYYPNANVQVSP